MVASSKLTRHLGGLVHTFPFDCDRVYCDRLRDHTGAIYQVSLEQFLYAFIPVLFMHYSFAMSLKRFLIMLFIYSLKSHVFSKYR